eukprot:scaffold138773_cov39-Prasinocladus_malaysianus.AAC.1
MQVSAKLHLLQSSKYLEESDDDDEEMSDSDSDDEANGEEPPQMHLRQIAHPGGVNRVRAMPQQGSVVATWSEKGTVH